MRLLYTVGTLSTPTQGGIESEVDYPYCSGDGSCYPCVPAGWNNTRCGPPPLYCNKTQSCQVKLDQNKFIPGLKIKDWVAVLVCGTTNTHISTLSSLPSSLPFIYPSFFLSTPSHHPLPLLPLSPPLPPFYVSFL